MWAHNITTGTVVCSRRPGCGQGVLLRLRARKAADPEGWRADFGEPEAEGAVEPGSGRLVDDDDESGGGGG